MQLSNFSVPGLCFMVASIDVKLLLKANGQRVSISIKLFY